MNYGLLDLKLPHPVERPFQYARSLVYELIDEEPPQADDEEMTSKLAPTPAQLEVSGTGGRRVLSLHFVHQPFTGNISRLEQICQMPSSTREEKEKQAKQLVEELEKFALDQKEPPRTFVYEFSIADGLLQRICKYAGSFTEPGWRWSADRRTFDQQDRALKSYLSLAKDGYRRAQQCQEILSSLHAVPDLPLHQADTYQFYLSALTMVADKAAMKHFVGSLPH